MEEGIASWYGREFHGRRTASGEIYDMHALTAAHRTLPFGTLLEVYNLDNGRSVQVRVNDRGPFVKGRILDLSRAAAEELGMVTAGLARVRIAVLAWPQSLPGLRYTVQVGAFEDPARAHTLQQDLKRTYPQTVVRSDGIWHRVQVGEFDDRRKAEDLRKRLSRLGFAAVIVALR